MYRVIDSNSDNRPFSRQGPLAPHVQAGRVRAGVRPGVPRAVLPERHRRPRHELHRHALALGHARSGWALSKFNIF